MGSIQPPPDHLSPIRRVWWRLVRFGFRLLYNELAFIDLIREAWQEAARATPGVMAAVRSNPAPRPMAPVADTTPAPGKG